MRSCRRMVPNAHSYKTNKTKKNGLPDISF